MEYVYAVLLLHKLGKPVDEEGLKKVLQAGGTEADEGKIKSLITSLKDVDIDKELENAAMASVAPVSVVSEAPKEEEPKEEKKEAAAEGLASLFG